MVAIWSGWVNFFPAIRVNYSPAVTQMTAAMIDRLVHHSYLLLFDGQSNRVRDSLMKSSG